MKIEILFNKMKIEEFIKLLWMRTLNVAFWVTVFCFILAYPISHLLATLTNEIQ